MKPIRILHVLGRLDRGGGEVWLMNMLRNIDRSQYHLDFLVHVDYPCAFDGEARHLGAQILRLRAPKRIPFTYNRNLAALLRTCGPYDVVHSHVHYFSGLILKTAARCGVPVRIAHSHNDTRRVDGQTGLLRRWYLAQAGRQINRHATQGLACSSAAAIALFGERWSDDPRWKVLHYGIDFTRFSRPSDPGAVRKQWGIPADRRVLGQVARLDPQKNHGFTLRVFREMITAGINVHLLLVGAGPSETEIRSQIDRAGLGERTTLVGDQADVAPYLAAMDCMIFPSTHEGLGIVALEAQAASVPTVASDRVPQDVHVIPGMVRFLPLEASLSQWVAAIEATMKQPRRDIQESVHRMQESDFSVARCLEQLCMAYRASTLPFRPAAEAAPAGTIALMPTTGPQRAP